MLIVEDLWVELDPVQEALPALHRLNAAVLRSSQQVELWRRLLNLTIMILVNIDNIPQAGKEGGLSPQS